MYVKFSLKSVRINSGLAVWKIDGYLWILREFNFKLVFKGGLNTSFK